MNLEDTLADLHEQLAEKLLEKIKSGEATASDMRNALQMLKDNGINVAALPNDGTPVGKLLDEVSPLPSDEDLNDPPSLSIVA